MVGTVRATDNMTTGKEGSADVRVHANATEHRILQTLHPAYHLLTAWLSAYSVPADSRVLLAVQMNAPMILHLKISLLVRKTGPRTLGAIQAAPSVVVDFTTRAPDVEDEVLSQRRVLVEEGHDRSFQVTNEL